MGFVKTSELEDEPEFLHAEAKKFIYNNNISKISETNK
jgi:hypothetical protein